MSELRFGASVVRLMQARDAPAQSIFGLDASIEIRCLASEIDDFGETVAACRDASVEFWLEVEPIRDLLIAMVKDPEGNIVEFIGHGEPG